MGNNPLTTYSLQGSTILTPHKLLKNKSIIIEKENIKYIGNKASYHINLPNDSYVYPALINVHDHLRGDYLPKIGPKNKKFYIKCNNWEKELRSSQVVKERSKISEKNCYFLDFLVDILTVCR